MLSMAAGCKQRLATRQEQKFLYDRDLIGNRCPTVILMAISELPAMILDLKGDHTQLASALERLPTAPAYQGGIMSVADPLARDIEAGPLDRVGETLKSDELA